MSQLPGKMQRHRLKTFCRVECPGFEDCGFVVGENDSFGRMNLDVVQAELVADQNCRRT